MNRYQRRARARANRVKGKYATVQASLPHHGFYTNRARLVWLAHRMDGGTATRSALAVDWQSVGPAA